MCAEGLGDVLLHLVQVAQRDAKLRALFVQQLERLQAVHLQGSLLCAYEHGCMHTRLGRAAERDSQRLAIANSSAICRTGQHTCV